jgi:microcystin-dependent protein
MSDPFLGQIIPVALDFAPTGWLPCDGRLIDIGSHAALFNLLGTTYGGDGMTTFGLPDLRGRLAVGSGQGPGLQNYTAGMVAGTEDVTLTLGQLAAHSHPIMAAADGSTGLPAADTLLGTPASGPFVYLPGPGNTTLANSSVNFTNDGPGGPHENRQPFQAITYIIATEGIYPSPPH